jgi:hypothetical protein
MYLGIGHKLTENETYYKPNHVDATQKYRSDLLKDVTKNEILKLSDLGILRDRIDSFIDLIDDILLNQKK